MMIFFSAAAATLARAVLQDAYSRAFLCLVTRRDFGPHREAFFSIVMAKFVNILCAIV